MGLFGDKKETVNAVIFDRDDEFEFRKCEVVAGIASYKTGGFNVRNDEVLPFIEGGTFLEKGETYNRRSTKPIFVTRVGEHVGIRFRKDQLLIEEMTANEFELRDNMAAEIGLNEAGKKLTSLDWINLSLVVAILGLLVPIIFIAMQVAITGDSSDNGNTSINTTY